MTDYNAGYTDKRCTFPTRTLYLNVRDRFICMLEFGLNQRNITIKNEVVVMIVTSKATKVLWAGTGINLVIGVLYTWTIFKESLVVDLGWTNSDASLPYTASVVCFSIALLLAGFLQDQFGPQKMLIAGIFTVSSGLIASGFASEPWMLILTFGVIVGSGIGMTYACLPPTTMKWFHTSQKGMVSGLTIAGFGFAPLYFAPIISWLISHYNISVSFVVIGIAVLIVALPLTVYIHNPPNNFDPKLSKPEMLYQRLTRRRSKSSGKQNFLVSEMLKTPQFYSLWIIFAFASSAGFMVISHVLSIASTRAILSNTTFLLSLLALCNSVGRISAGMLSDKIGRVEAMLLFFFLQTLNMLFFKYYSSLNLLSVGVMITGFCYGALFGIFPATIADYFGLKNYGANYGVFFTSWGFSGVIGPMVTAWLGEKYSYYDAAYISSALLLSVAFLCALTIKPIKKCGSCYAKSSKSRNT